MQRHSSKMAVPAGAPAARPLGLLAIFLAGFALFGCASSKDASEAAYPQSAPGAPARDYSKDSVSDQAYATAAESAPEAPSSWSGSSGNLGAAPAPPPAQTPAPQPTPGGPAPATPGEAASTTSEPKRAPLLIYDAVVTLAVFKASEGIDAVQKLALASGGYLVQRSDNEIKVRVPTKAFNASLEAVTKLGDELHRQVNVRDVTEEFSDLQTRLQNARAVRARLEELLKQAQKVEEALAVEKELERVAGEVEQILGRLKLLSELLAFSTITVRFEARPVDMVGSDVTLPFPWLHELGLPGLLSL